MSDWIFDVTNVVSTYSPNPPLLSCTCLSYQNINTTASIGNPIRALCSISPRLFGFWYNGEGFSRNYLLPNHFVLGIKNSCIETMRLVSPSKYLVDRLPASLILALRGMRSERPISQTGRSTQNFASQRSPSGSGSFYIASEILPSLLPLTPCRSTDKLRSRSLWSEAPSLHDRWWIAI